jgi:hypothetical protein
MNNVIKLRCCWNELLIAILQLLVNNTPLRQHLTLRNKWTLK